MTTVAVVSAEIIYRLLNAIKSPRSKDIYLFLEEGNYGIIVKDSNFKVKYSASDLFYKYKALEPTYKDGLVLSLSKVFLSDFLSAKVSDVLCDLVIRGDIVEGESKYNWALYSGHESLSEYYLVESQSSLEQETNLDIHEFSFNLNDFYSLLNLSTSANDILMFTPEYSAYLPPNYERARLVFSKESLTYLLYYDRFKRHEYAFLVPKKLKDCFSFFLDNNSKNTNMLLETAKYSQRNGELNGIHLECLGSTNLSGKRALYIQIDVSFYLQTLDQIWMNYDIDSLLIAKLDSLSKTNPEDYKNSVSTLDSHTISTIAVEDTESPNVKLADGYYITYKDYKKYIEGGYQYVSGKHGEYIVKIAVIDGMLIVYAIDYIDAITLHQEVKATKVQES